MSLQATARHGARLRWSILAAAGIVPLACSGKTINGGEEPDERTVAGTGSGGKGSGVSTPGSTAGKASTGRAGMTGVGGAIQTGGTGPIGPTCTAAEHDALRGLVHCAEGYTYRPVPFACEAVGGAPDEEPFAGGASGAGGASSAAGETGSGDLPRADGSVHCRFDEQVCRAFEMGYCDEGDDWDGGDQGAGGQAPAVCRSGCLTDQDCGAGYMCLCGGPSPSGGRCVASPCRSDDDCEPGYHCASYDSGCGSGWSCQTPRDSCWGDAQCADGEGCYPEDGPRQCYELWVCGRPFLVERQARTAEPVASDAWLDAERATPNLAGLSSNERAALAQHWTQLALLEHASIAAFARFSLQLLSLGAPPQLVEDCTSALADESAHARLCFRLASAYAGHALGPGPLDITSSLEVTSLADIVDLVLAEGCFGETIAALDALDAADTATDPVIVEAYARIASDEQRHAELAFRFVRWALARDAGTVTPRLLAALATPPNAHPAAQEVVLPCLRELLALATSASGQKDPMDKTPDAGTRAE